VHEVLSCCQVVVLVVRGFDKASPSALSSWMPATAARRQLQPLERAWLSKTFARYGAVALKLPADTSVALLYYTAIYRYLFATLL
jgi:hypothetical protein